jgi:hypothetical protein
MLARLRPHPHRGDTVAAGVVVLTLFTLITVARFAGDWSAGVRFVFVAAVAALVVAMAVQADAGDGLPRPYESVLHVSSFLLVLAALGELADVLGSNGGSGTVGWVGALLVAYCGWFATRRNSAIMTLLGAATGVVVVTAFVDWAFSPDSISTFRWILLLCALALTLGAVQQRDAHRRHAVSLADVAGLAIIVLGATLVLDQAIGLIGGIFSFGGGTPHVPGGPVGWELVLLAYGCGLIAYGCVDRERVPPFLGILVLGLFLTQTGVGDSLIGWPIVLLLLAGALLAIGLRPRRELPPEPPVPHA